MTENALSTTPAATVTESRGHGWPKVVSARLQPSEESIQRAVVDLLRRAACPDVAWTHMPSGEARGPGLGGKLKGMGVQAGWPDLLLVRDGRLFGLELKRPSGRLSPSQTKAQGSLRLAGATIETAFGLDAAIAVLARWGMLRNARTG